MLFAQIISFIIVMVVFEAYQPGKPTLTPDETLLACLGVAVWLWLGSRLAVSRFIWRLSTAKAPLDPARSARRLIAILQGAAVFSLVLMIVVMDLKAHLIRIPWVLSSETLSGLCAVCLYFCLLSLIWFNTHTLERLVFAQNLDRWPYVRGQVRFCAPVVFPWLMVAVMRDLGNLLWPQALVPLNPLAGDMAMLVVFLLLISVFFPPSVRYWWGCRPWPEGPVRDLSQTVLDRAGVRVKEILSWPILQGRLMTAGVLGVFPRFRYLLLTPALTQSLSPEELAAVVAHEAGHVHHRHMLLYLLFFLGYFVAAFALSEPIGQTVSALLPWLAASDWGQSLLDSSQPGGAWFSVIFALPLVVLMVVYLRYILGFFMRHFERQADFYALQLLGSASPLMQALEKVAQYSGNTRDVPSWHHFSVAQRVDALRQAGEQPERIRTHAQGIKRGFALYIIGLVTVLGLSWMSASWELGEQTRRAGIIKLLERKLAQSPRDHRLLLNLGILRMESGDEPGAVNDLTKALMLAPRDPEALNSLAWILVTAKDTNLRRPREALQLALQAVSIKPSPHIWDTLAEAYFANHKPMQALAAAKAALAAGPKQRLSYFKSQLKRFEKAAQAQAGAP
ncbi:MAG: M48 family metalloprotease [Desulfarculaceae bacterium]|jgi:Zn-dependent protease with chaperone function